MIDRDFALFLMPGVRAKLEAQAKTKQRRTAKPGTIGAMSREQLGELVKASLARAFSGLAKSAKSPEIRFKDFATMDRAEALRMMLAMTSAEQEQIWARLERADQAARNAGMSLAEFIEFFRA